MNISPLIDFASDVCFVLLLIYCQFHSINNINFPIVSGLAPKGIEQSCFNPVPVDKYLSYYWMIGTKSNGVFVRYLITNKCNENSLDRVHKKLKYKVL